MPMAQSGAGRGAALVLTPVAPAAPHESQRCQPTRCPAAHPSQASPRGRDCALRDGFDGFALSPELLFLKGVLMCVLPGNPFRAAYLGKPRPSSTLVAPILTCTFFHRALRKRLRNDSGQRLFERAGRHVHVRVPSFSYKCPPPSLCIRAHQVNFGAEATFSSQLGATATHTICEP